MVESSASQIQSNLGNNHSSDSDDNDEGSYYKVVNDFKLSGKKNLMHGIMIESIDDMSKEAMH